LLLDEPAAGLTMDERKRLSDLLCDLASNGLVVLIVEHNVPFLAGLSARLICMAEGKVIAEGPPHIVITAPIVREAYLGAMPP
jgi:branched-chain amino acid transport system permease protein